MTTRALQLSVFCTVALAVGSLHAAGFVKGLKVDLSNTEEESEAGGDAGADSRAGVTGAPEMTVIHLPKDWMKQVSRIALIESLEGAWAGGQPTLEMDWHEVAAVVHWLDTRMGKRAVYSLKAECFGFAGADPTARGQACLYYFLPSDQEWFNLTYETAGHGHYFLPKLVAAGALDKSAPGEDAEAGLPGSSVADAQFWKRSSED